MSRAARSLTAFAAYLAVAGGWLLVTPNSMLGPFGMPPSSDAWVWVVGVLMLILAVNYALAARADVTRFIVWTAYVRGAVIVVSPRPADVSNGDEESWKRGGTAYASRLETLDPASLRDGVSRGIREGHTGCAQPAS